MHRDATLPAAEAPLRLPEPRILLATAPAALLGVSFGLGKIVRDCSLTCNVGFELAPLAILAVALVTLPLSALRVRLEQRWGYRRWQIGSALVAAASFFAFRALTYLLLQRQIAAEATGGDAFYWSEALRFAYLGFFVWMGAAVALLSANAYAHVGSVFPGEREERVLGYVALSAVVGGVLGSWLAQRASVWAIARFGWPFETVRDNLMIGMGVAVLLLIPVVVALSRHVDASGTETSALTEPAVSLGTALRWIREDATLARLAVLILAAGVADTLGKYLFYWLVAEQTRPDPSAGRTLYFATFYAWLNGVSLLMLAFGTSRVIRRIGVALALVSLPLALSLGTAYLALNMMLVVMYALRVLEGAMHSSLYDPALDLVQLGVADSRRRIVRPVLSGLVARTGEGVGAVLVLGLAFGLHVSLRQMLWFYLAVLAVWGVAALALGARREAPAKP